MSLTLLALFKKPPNTVAYFVSLERVCLTDLTFPGQVMKIFPRPVIPLLISPCSIVANQ